MLKFFLICCVIVVFIALFCWVTRNYVNPYKLIFVFGKKGSGKSTLLTKLAVRYSKKKWTVYTTENISGTHNITDPKQIYKMDFPARSCILIDEVSLIWDNRDFKSMDKRVVEWFRYQRHHKCRVYFFSQTFDIDKKMICFWSINISGFLSLLSTLFASLLSFIPARIAPRVLMMIWWLMVRCFGFLVVVLPHLSRIGQNSLIRISCRIQTTKTSPAGVKKNFFGA